MDMIYGKIDIGELQSDRVDVRLSAACGVLWAGDHGSAARVGRVARQILLQVSALTIFIRPGEGRHFTA